MRILRSPSLLAATTLLLAGLPRLAAQDPTPPAPTPPPAATGEGAESAPPSAPGERPEGQPRRRRQAIVIEAGTVHPVAGPAIQDGVVVVRGERIVAVGKRGEVEVPPNAIVRSFPDGHVYPGLVDAQTDAFADDALRQDGSLDGGAQLADDLRRRFDRDDALAAAGITTAYVTVRSPAQLRGQGAVVRPHADGFEVWTDHAHPALELRMTNGAGATHPLQRQQQLRGTGSLFEGLDEFRKAHTEHDEAVKKYDKEFADYLAWHTKKKGGDKPAEAPKTDAPKPAATPTPNEPPGGAQQGPPRRRRGGPGGGGGGGGGDAGGGEAADVIAQIELLAAAAPQEPAKQEPAKQEPGKPDAPKPEGGQQPEAKKDEAPKRPTWPKPVPPDPQKDALLAVVDGELTLRVEAHRPDEVRAALQLQKEHDVPLLVLTQAYGAAALAEQIAAQGARVVLTEVLPDSLPKDYDEFDPTTLPARLQAAGVPFAIASGGARRADLLPLMAATAVGGGLAADAALRAITLTPAEILGVDKDTGSLVAGKFGDVLVTDRPLFASDSHVLLVLGKGHIEYEAK